MSAMIYLDDSSRLKGFSAASKGGKSTVKIEVECSDPYSLGHLLAELQSIEKAQRTAKAARPPRDKERQLALPAPRLQLTYDHGENL